MINEIIYLNRSINPVMIAEFRTPKIAPVEALFAFTTSMLIIGKYSIMNITTMKDAPMSIVWKLTFNLCVELSPLNFQWISWGSEILSE